jgi:hypothetical protein
MQTRIYVVVLIGAFVCAAAALAEDGPDSGPPCVEVQIGQDSAAHLDCLNAAFQRQARREHAAPSPEAPVNARSSPNRVGLFNDTAAHQMMGNAYGVSAQPQRPRAIFTSPLAPLPR